MLKIAIIVGSTRPGRKARAVESLRLVMGEMLDQVAAWSGALQALRQDRLA